MSSCFTIIQPALPCATCEAECCHAVPVSEREAEEIHAHLESLPNAETDRLAKQKRSELMCPFVDIENGHRCAIYDHRPKICRLFGHYKGRLACSHAPEVAKLEESLATIQMTAELKAFCAEGGRGAMLGVSVTWDALIPKRKK